MILQRIITKICISTRLSGTSASLKSSLVFWFTFTTLIVLFSAATGSYFQQNSSKNPLYTTLSAPNSRQTLLATAW